MMKFFTKKLNGNKVTYLLFTLSTYFNTFLFTISSILIMRWVLPTDLGYWNAIYLFSPYAGILQLGIFSGLNRELPFLLGAGKQKEAHESIATSYYFAKKIIQLCLLFGILYITLAHYLFNESFKYLFSVSCFILIIISNQVQMLWVSTFRSNGSFKRLSIINVITGLLSLMMLYIVFLFKYNGLVLFYLVQSLSVAVIMHLTRPYRIKPLLVKKQLAKLIKTGFPLYIFGYLQVLSKSFPRVIILNFGGKLALGLFSPVNALMVAFNILPAAISQFLFPKMSYVYGQTNNKKDLWKYIKKTTQILLLLNTVIAIPLIVIIPYFISKFFDAYSLSIVPTQIIIVSGIFMASGISINALYSVKAFKAIMWSTIASLLLYSITPLLFCLFYSPLIGGTLGILVASVIFLVFSLLQVNKVLNA